MNSPPSRTQINPIIQPCVVSPRTKDHPSMRSVLKWVPATSAVKSRRITAVR